MPIPSFSEWSAEVRPAVRAAGRTFRPRPLSRILLLAFAVAFAVLAPGCGGESNPRTSARPSDDDLIDLDRAYQPLRQDFEEAKGKVRLVGILAPTCGECVESAQSIIENLVPKVPGGDLQVMLVWSGIMPTDVRLRAQKVVETAVGPGVKNYWEPTGSIARVFGRLSDLEPGRSLYDVYFLYGPSDTWDPDGTMKSEPPDENALVAGWLPSTPRLMMGETKFGGVSPFDMAHVLKLVDEIHSGGPAEP